MSDLATVLSVLGRPIDTACKLVENLFGEPFKVAGDALADQVRFWQWKNRITILEKAKQILEQKGIKERRLNPEFFLPFIQESGNSESEELQNAWAALLAGAVEDDSCEHVGFVNTLANLSAVDVRVLDCMIHQPFAERDERKKMIANQLGLSEEKVRLSFQNFLRLGLFTPTSNKLSGFGGSFLRVCLGDAEAMNAYLENEKANAKLNIVFD